MTRMLAALIVLAVAGCGRSPESLGITGPAPPVNPPVVDDSTIANPGVPDPGMGYGNSVGPATQTGRYYNYN